MLLRVPGPSSSLGFAATVTHPARELQLLDHLADSSAAAQPLQPEAMGGGVLEGLKSSSGWLHRSGSSLAFKRRRSLQEPHQAREDAGSYLDELRPAGASHSRLLTPVVDPAGFQRVSSDLNLKSDEVAMDSSERPSSERFFRQGKMAVPDLCFNGMPGYLYTGATCLAALLLLFEQDRQLVEESCESRSAALELFECEAFKGIVHGRLFHHHHNPTLAKIMVQIGLKTIVILPDPVTIFSNLSRPCPSPKTSIVTSSLKTFKEWLEFVPLLETYPHLIIFSRPRYRQESHADR